METMVDQKGNTHYVKDKIGIDGQGTLYSTKNSGIIVRETVADDNFENAAVLPLDELPNILTPAEYLKAPKNGYVIHLPEGVIPLENAGNLTLKRRLTILANMAKILIKLHSMPIIYGSLSPLRIFIEPKTDEVYLLYSSKMDFCMRFTEENDADTYVAPEAQKGQGCTLLSDVYTLGSFTTDFLDLEKIELLEELKTLLDSTKKEPENRPKMSELYKILFKQLDLLLTCKKCKDDFHYMAEKCPFCETPPPKMLKASIYDVIEENPVQRGLKILEFAAKRQCFFNYHTENILLDTQIFPTIDCILNITEGRRLNLIFKNLMPKTISINGKTVSNNQATIVQLPCEIIKIEFPLYSEITRHIDLVMS